MLSAMPTSLTFSPRSNPSLQHSEITYPLLDLCHMHPILSCSYPLRHSNNCSNFLFVNIFDLLWLLCLLIGFAICTACLLYTSPSPRD